MDSQGELMETDEVKGGDGFIQSSVHFIGQPLPTSTADTQLIQRLGNVNMRVRHFLESKATLIETCLLIADFIKWRLR